MDQVLRSRLQSPASTSMEVTRKPRRAREAERFAVAVVFLTPPFSEVMATVFGGENAKFSEDWERGLGTRETFDSYKALLES
jgi:hypothetical protein